MNYIQRLRGSILGIDLIKKEEVIVHARRRLAPHKSIHENRAQIDWKILDPGTESEPRIHEIRDWLNMPRVRQVGAPLENSEPDEVRKRLG